MRIRLRKKSSFGDRRTESVSKIDDILAKGDILMGDGKINLYFRGKDSSGIIGLEREEAEMLVNSVSKVLKVFGKGKII